MLTPMIQDWVVVHEVLTRQEKLEGAAGQTSEKTYPNSVQVS